MSRRLRKVCRDCGETKFVNDFYRYRNGTYRAQCKDCCRDQEAVKRAIKRGHRPQGSGPSVHALMSGWGRVTA